MQTFFELVLTLANAFFYVLLVVIGFALFDLSTHTDIFTAAAIVAFICAPSVSLD